MKIYAIGGLGADERVFKKLDLSEPFYIIQWIDPYPKESLDEYAHRLVAQINLNDEVLLIGVSFGGMLAIALQKIIKPKFSILISSARNKYDLPGLYRWLGKTNILSLIPAYCFKLPDSIAVWLFGAENKALLSEINESTDVHFLKWALITISKWSETKNNPVLSIHGTQDKIIPYPRKTEVIPIEKTGHFMIVDRAAQISSIIHEKLKNIN